MTASTLLGPGITVGKFLRGSANGAQDYNELTNQDEIEANLYKHVEFILAVNSRFSAFPNHRLDVAEGVYIQGSGETLGGFNDTKSTGESVVYRVLDRNGNVDPSATYDVAVWWKRYMEYGEVALSYDTINPDGSLNANIILTVGSGNSINTYFNNSLAFSNELVEITL